MRWCVSRSEVLQGLRALRRLELRDAESPEDVERTLFVLDLFQDCVETGSCRVLLEAYYGCLFLAGVVLADIHCRSVRFHPPPSAL